MSVREEFAKEYDAWDKKNPRVVFVVGTTSDVLKSIGIKDKVITWDSSKIIQIKSKHLEMTDDVIKQVPNVIENPIIIMNAKNNSSRLTMFGELFANGKPVLVVLELNPNDRNGFALDELKIASAYGKDKVQNFINTSSVVYINSDKKRISNWEKRTGLLLPVGISPANSNTTIPQNAQGVNSNSMQNGKNNSEKFSSRDTEYLELAKEPEKNKDKLQAMVQAAANGAGYDMHLYSGSKSGGGFTVFRDWQYFTENKAYAERYINRGTGKGLYEVYVKSKNMFDTRKESDKAVFEQYRNEYGMGELQENGLPDWTDGYDISEIIDENNLDYDGIILDEGGDLVNGEPVSRGDSYVIRKSNQIKSADLVTYDDDGNIIPLSERFNDKENDIRFSSRDYSEIDVDEFDENDYTKLKLTPRDVKRFYSEAITWDADKVGQICKKNLGAYTYVYSVNSDHTLTLLGKHKYTNIHERGKIYDEYKPNRKKNDRNAERYGGGQRNSDDSLFISNDRTASRTNDKLSNQKTRTERRSDGTGYTESGNNVDSQEENGEVKNQTRNTDGLDNRTLLANALETVAQNDVEREYLATYKEITHEINEKQEQLGEYRRQIKELSFAKGKRDTETITKLKNRADILEAQINRADKRLLNFESTEALKKVLEREKKAAYKKAKAEGDKILQEYRDKQKATLTKQIMLMLALR